MESMFINLTPHTITIVGGTVIPPSGQAARCSTTSKEVGSAEGVAFYQTTYGDVTGLPPPSPGRFLIVSAMVRQAVTWRKDVVSPGEPVRDSDGQIIGCRGLITNG